MTVGVLAVSLERARNIITTDPIISSSSDAVPLSPRSMGHRGRIFDAIFVDQYLWPLTAELIDEFGPCMCGTDGAFYIRMSL